MAAGPHLRTRSFDDRSRRTGRPSIRRRPIPTSKTAGNSSAATATNGTSCTSPPGWATRISPRVSVLDLASSLEEYKAVKAALDGPGTTYRKPALDSLVAKKAQRAKGRVYVAKLGKAKPYAALATWPWFEDRGPNPYMLVTGQAGIPWEAGHFWDWFLARSTPGHDRAARQVRAADRSISSARARPATRRSTSCA